MTSQELTSFQQAGTITGTEILPGYQSITPVQISTFQLAQSAIDLAPYTVVPSVNIVSDSTKLAILESNGFKTTTLDSVKAYVIAALDADDYTGPPGPEGEQGPQGIPGPQGEQGIPGSDATLPAYAYTETINGFLPGVAVVDAVTVWTAGVTVKFQNGFQGFGHVLVEPTSELIIDIINSQNLPVGEMVFNSSGIITFNTFIFNDGPDYTIQAGDYLKFKVSANNADASDISFAVVGQRTA